MYAINERLRRSHFHENCSNILHGSIYLLCKSEVYIKRYFPATNGAYGDTKYNFVPKVKVCQHKQVNVNINLNNIVINDHTTINDTSMESSRNYLQYKINKILIVI